MSSGVSFAPPAAIDTLLPDEQQTVGVFARAAPSVVHITTSRTVGMGAGDFSLDLAEIPAGTGSGFVWDAKGHVVTNFHVVKGAAEGFRGRAKVSLSALEPDCAFDATLVGTEPDKDIAVLRLDPSIVAKSGRVLGDLLAPIPVGSSRSLCVGQRVLAIGNPFGLDQTLTSGIVSGLGRDFRSVGGRMIRGVVQTDAAINPGNSGGPLLDARGRLIGINTAILSPSGAFAGVGFAVPADTVVRVVSDIIKYGRVMTPSLGLSIAQDEYARQVRAESAPPPPSTDARST